MLSDWGGEYLNNEFQDYKKQNEIVPKRTPPYLPQLNGVLEGEIAPYWIWYDQWWVIQTFLNCFWVMLWKLLSTF